MSEDLEKDAKEEMAGGNRAGRVVIVALLICIALGLVAAYFLTNAAQPIP